MLRIFLGISIPNHIRSMLAGIQGGVPGAKWVTPENYHITLKFIGDVNEVVKEDIAEALDELAFPVFTISLQSIGIFTHGNDPHHIWIKPTPEVQIIKLNSKIENLLQTKASLKAETRKFTPHLTLAKMQDTNPDKKSDRDKLFDSTLNPNYSLEEKLRDAISAGKSPTNELYIEANQPGKEDTANYNSFFYYT